MSDQADNLQSRVDEAFEAAVSAQLSEQREIRRLVNRVEETVSALTGGFSELTDQVTRGGDDLRIGVTNELGALNRNLEEATHLLQQAAQQSSSSLEQAVERLYAVAAQARDTNGSVLAEAVEEMRKVLTEGNGQSRAALDRLTSQLEGTQSTLAGDVREVLTRVREALDHQAETYAARLATTVVEIREQLEATSQRDEGLLRQAIGAIENRMDYGRAQVGEQLESAHQALLDDLALERTNREHLIARLDRSLEHMDADRERRREEFQALSDRVGVQLDDAVAQTGVQWREAVSALERATTGLHDDRDAGRAELAQSLAALTGVTDTSTRRLDQLNAMIDALQSSTDGIAPVLEEAVMNLNTRVSEQLADQRQHADAVAARIERAHSGALSATSGKLDDALATFTTQAKAVLTTEQAQLDKAVKTVNLALDELTKANGGFVADWDDRTQQVVANLAEQTQSLVAIAEQAGANIVGEVRAAASELAASQAQSIELSTQARTSLSETQRTLGLYIEQFEPVMTAAVEAMYARIEDTLNAMNGDVRENALSVSAQMRDSSADLRQQIGLVMDQARQEVQSISEEAAKVNQQDRDRLERTMTELNDASMTVRATMEHLVAQARKEMATVRVETLAQLDAAVRDVEKMGATLPGKVAEAAKGYELALTNSSQEITALTKGLDVVVNQRLDRLERSTVELTEANERMRDIILDQVSRLRASVETASEQFVQRTDEQTGIYQRDLAGALETTKTAMAERLDEAAKHLSARAVDVQEANSRGANRIEAVGAQLVATLEQIQPQVDNTLAGLGAMLTKAAVEERTRTDANLDRLTGVINQRMASFDGALNDLANRLVELNDDAKAAQGLAVATFTDQIMTVQREVQSSLAQSSQEIIDTTGQHVDEQLRESIADLVKAIQDAKTFSATSHGQTQQAMTEAESAYRNATNRLEEVVDSSRREIERAITQTADQLERRTGAMGSTLREEISTAVGDSLSKAGDQFTRQVELMANREEKGLTRLVTAADAVSHAVAGVEDRIDTALLRLHEERPDPVPALMEAVEKVHTQLQQREQALASNHLNRLDEIEQRVTAITARVESNLEERMNDLIARVDDVVANRFEQAMASLEQRMIAQLDQALAKRSDLERAGIQEMEAIRDQVSTGLDERLTDVHTQVASHMRRLADQQSTITQFVSDRIGQTSAEMERKLTDIQGDQLAKMEAVTDSLNALAKQDRSEDRRRVDDLVATIGRHVAELSVVVKAVEDLDDRVASRVSRSLTELRHGLVDEVRSVSREASTIRPGQQIFAPPTQTKPTARPADTAVVPLKAPKPGLTRQRLAPPDRREPVAANTTCPNCGFIARTSVGLATHLRSCTKR